MNPIQLQGGVIQKRLRRIKVLCLGCLLFVSAGLIAQGGNADPTKESTPDIPDFHSIYVSGVAKVFFTQDSQTTIKETLSGTVVPQLIKEVENGVLKVYTEGSARGEVVEVFVSNPELKHIEVWDRAEFHNSETLKADILEIEVHEVGAAFTVVDTNKVIITMNGGDLQIAGITRKQQIIKTASSERGSLEDEQLIILE